MALNTQFWWSEEERGSPMYGRCAISQRTYSQEFKLSMVHLVIDGEKTPSQVCRENPVSKSVLYRWLQDFTMRGEIAFQRIGRYQRNPNILTMTVLGVGTGETFIAPESYYGSPETRIADLERLCGRLAMEKFLLKQAQSEAGQSAP